MLDRFQNLPTAARIALSALFVVLVIGAIALLAKLSAGPTAPDEAPSAAPSYTTGATPAPSTSATRDVDPNSLGPGNLAPSEPATEIYGKNRRYSDSQLNAAAGVAKDALLANCHYAADQSAEQWANSQERYYQSGDGPSPSDHISLIDTQRCSISDVKPQSQTSDSLIVGVAADQVTVYAAGAPIVPDSDDKTSYYYPLGGTITLKLVGGKWYVTSFDVEQQQGA